MQVSHALHSCYRPNHQLVGGVIATPLSLQHRSHTPTRTDRALHKQESRERVGPNHASCHRAAEKRGMLINNAPGS